MRKSELKEIIKSSFLAEAEDSKKGNSEEQKRMEGAIRDDRDHIKNLKKDIEDNEKKLAKLKKDLSSLRQSTQYYNIYRSLAEDGAIYVNTYSQDCDGVEAYGSYVYTTLEEYKDGEESFYGSIEGNHSWEIVSKEDARPQEECGTYGQGWDIH